VAESGGFYGSSSAVVEGLQVNLNKHVFGDVAFRKKCLLTELLELDMREKLQVLSLEDRSRRTVTKADIKHLASLEEISWMQKNPRPFS